MQALSSKFGSSIPLPDSPSPAASLVCPLPAAPLTVRVHVHVHVHVHVPTQHRSTHEHRSPLPPAHPHAIGYHVSMTHPGTLHILTPGCVACLCRSGSPAQGALGQPPPRPASPLRLPCTRGPPLPKPPARPRGPARPAPMCTATARPASWPALCATRRSMVPGQSRMLCSPPPGRQWSTPRLSSPPPGRQLSTPRLSSLPPGRR